MQTLRQKDTKAVKEWQKALKRQNRKQRVVLVKKALDDLKKEEAHTKHLLANAYSEEMSRNPTKEELIMIEILDYYNVKYSFQKIVRRGNAFFIVDFWVSTQTVPLVIEIDGGRHFTEEGKRKDKHRTDVLKKWTHCHMLRFANAMLQKQPEKVAEFVIFKLGSMKA